MKHSMRSVSLAFPCRGINSEHKMAFFKSEFLSIPQENCQEKSRAADVEQPPIHTVLVHKVAGTHFTVHAHMHAMHAAPVITTRVLCKCMYMYMYAYTYMTAGNEYTHHTWDMCIDTCTYECTHCDRRGAIRLPAVTFSFS